MKPSVLAALLAVQVLFGLNYVISKDVVTAFPPLAWASIRALISACLLVLVAILLNRKHPKLDRKFFLPLIPLSMLSVSLNQSLFLVGLTKTTATNSSILNTLIPVFTLLIVTLKGMERLTLKRAFGFLLGLLGVLALRGVENLSVGGETWVGDVMTILNCACYATFLVVGKQWISQYDKIWATAWLFIAGSLTITIFATPDLLHMQWPVMTWSLGFAAFYAVFLGTFATYLLNFWALARAKSSSVSLFIYLQPVVAVLLAWGWKGEVPTLRSLGAGLLIFLGMLSALKS